MIRSCTAALLALSVGLAGGCGRGPRTEDIPVKPSNDPLEPARAALGRYAEGQPMGSEVTTFPHMVGEVRKVDPARADLLEKGLEDIQKNPGQSRARAKALLEKLRPSPK